MSNPVRLAKRLAEIVPCSRAQAEQYIEGGWVRVDGNVVDTPQYRVLDQKIELDPKASLAPLVPMTLLLHKPADYSWNGNHKPAAQLLRESNRAADDRSGIRLLQRHLLGQMCVTPLETGATGLLVFTQDVRIRRKLQEEAALVENEVIVDVLGKVPPGALLQLNRAPVIDGRAMLPAKVSLSSESATGAGLRFAVKGAFPGQILQMCESVGLRIVGMKRIRVGRVPLAKLATGQWRYLRAQEKF